MNNSASEWEEYIYEQNLNNWIVWSLSYGIVAIIQKEEIQAKYRNRLHR